ncbi:hypothetical protein Pmani_004497 [Petrolisthes manimaculis]|uniref:Uncharacterized protein n=1 Tax=Petrolisthes manimaculis TaxID=1843537 RepID=A0AAE1QEL9_9EUCA|nr:hypothetical protein Pmani_004497 [Petrolisthes manimaculis]
MREMKGESLVVEQRDREREEVLVEMKDNEPQSLFRGEGEASDSDTGEDPGPPASALTRRRALVPPKLLTDTANYDTHDHDHTQPLNGLSRGGEEVGEERREDWD